jgi:hypothetical protein
LQYFLKNIANVVALFQILIYLFFYTKSPLRRKELFICNRVYKPGSVLNGHLSLLIVTDELRDLSRATLQICVGQTSACGVASSRVYSGSMLP